MKNFVILGLAIIILTGCGCVSTKTRDGNFKFEVDISPYTKKIIISNNTKGQMYIYHCVCACTHGPCLHPSDFVMISAKKDKTPSPVGPGKFFTYQSNMARKIKLIVLVKDSTGQAVGISNETFWFNLNYWDIARWVFKEEGGHIRNYLEFIRDENLEKGEEEEK